MCAMTERHQAQSLACSGCVLVVSGKSRPASAVAELFHKKGGGLHCLVCFPSCLTAIANCV